jgi:hypothetical protein
LLIRVLTFRAGAPGEVTDLYLRQVLLPGLVDTPGLQHAYAGRIDTAGGGVRVVLSVWDADEPGQFSTPLPFETGEVIVEPVVELAPAEVALAFGTGGAVIMRVFRGRAKSGGSQEYLEAVRDGTLADVAAGRGPVALFLGMIDEQRFITASAWPDWQRIEAATGGNIYQPIGTRHRELLVEGTAEHFEVVPNSEIVPATQGAPARLAAGGPAGSGSLGSTSG